MRRYFAIAGIAILALATAGFSKARSNPFVGTWKLNVAKSKYNPGPPPKSQTRMWEPSGKVTVKGIDATGSARMYGYTIKTDGKDYPTTGAIPNGAQTIATTGVDATSVRATYKRDGKQVEITTFSVSKDGKMLTIVAKGSVPSGQTFDNMMSWDKQ
jgi:hypothetical protein